MPFLPQFLRQILTPKSRKVQATAEPSVMPPTPPASSPSRATTSQELDRRSMTPGTKVYIWNDGTPANGLTPPTTDRKRKRTSTRALTPSSSSYSGKTKRSKIMQSIEQPDDLANAPCSWQPEDTTNISTSSSVYDLDDIASDITSLAAPHQDPNPLERARREAQAASLLTQGWPVADQALFHKLDMRGFEPLLPKAWQHDLSALPDALFTKKDDLVFVKPLAKNDSLKNDFHAIRALTQVLELGPKVRDKLLVGRPPEALFKKTIEDYSKWSLTDAGLWKMKRRVPLLTVVTGADHVKPVTLQRKLIKSLEYLERRWRRVLDEDDALPPLYGIMVSHTIIALVSYVPKISEPKHERDTLSEGYESDIMEPSFRPIAIFDFNQPGTDVWNALAVAIVVIHCRNLLVELLESKDGVLIGSTESDSIKTDLDA